MSTRGAARHGRAHDGAAAAGGAVLLSRKAPPGRVKGVRPVRPLPADCRGADHCSGVAAEWEDLIKKSEGCFTKESGL
jgi:hypothetical protein